MYVSFSPFRSRRRLLIFPTEASSSVARAAPHNAPRDDARMGGGRGRGRGGRSNSWHRDGGGGGGGRGHGPVGVRRRDLLQEDLHNERPLWALSCYGPKGEQPNLLGGDTSFEELRCSAYATARAGSDARAVDARVREFVEAKNGDIKSILAFPEQQLKMVLDKVERGEMAPAGANRVIDGAPIASAGGGFAGGAGATMGGGFAGGGFAPPAGTSGNLNASASPFQPNAGAGGGFAGGGGFVGGGGFGGGGGVAGGGGFGGGGGFVSTSPQPPAPGAGSFSATSPSPFGGNATALAPLAPDPNVPNSEAWCAPSFSVGNIPDDPPPVAYIR